MRGKREEGRTEERKEKKESSMGKKERSFPKEKKGRIKVNYNKGAKSMSEGRKDNYTGEELLKVKERKDESMAKLPSTDGNY